MMEGDHFVTVHVATELLADLTEWSDPVQVQVFETPGHGTGYEMTFRVNEVDVRAERDAAVAKLAAIRALHREEWGACQECSDEIAVSWPCPTVLALDGEQR